MWYIYSNMPCFSATVIVSLRLAICRKTYLFSCPAIYCGQVCVPSIPKRRRMPETLFEYSKSCKSPSWADGGQSLHFEETQHFDQFVCSGRETAQRGNTNAYRNPNTPVTCSCMQQDIWWKRFSVKFVQFLVQHLQTHTEPSLDQHLCYFHPNKQLTSNCEATDYQLVSNWQAADERSRGGW